MTRRPRTSTRPLRHDRRFRRLLPMVLATATVAAGMPALTPTPARAARPHAAPPAARQPAVVTRSAVRAPAGPQERGQS